MSQSIPFPEQKISRRAKSIIFLTFSSLFFLIGAYRHLSFRSTALDLGIFSQAAWLISQGQVPISSFLGKHILGDHGAWIFYILAIPYKLFPSPLTLIAIQSIALGSCIFPIARLAKNFSTTEQKIFSICVLLHPTLWAVALFDFHPDVLAFVLLLWTAVFALEKRAVCMLLCALFAGGCKEVANATVLGVGLWAYFYASRSSGILLMTLGLSQGIFISQELIPIFGGGYSSGIDRFDEFGKTPLEIIFNVTTSPLLFLSKITLYTMGNTVALVLPFVVWIYYAVKSEGVLKSFYCLLILLPALLLNLTSTFPAQRGWSFHYQLPLILGMIILSTRRTTAPKIHLDKFSHLYAPATAFAAVMIAIVIPNFKSPGLSPLPWLAPSNLAALSEAITFVKPNSKVLTTWEIAPHLAEREEIMLIGETPKRLIHYDYVLLNFDSTLKLDSTKFERELAAIAIEKGFSAIYEKDGVLVLSK